MNRVQMIHLSVPRFVSVPVTEHGIQALKLVHFSLDWLFISPWLFHRSLLPFLLPLSLSLFLSPVPPSEVHVTRTCHEALMEHESLGPHNLEKNNPLKILAQCVCTKITRPTGRAERTPHSYIHSMSEFQLRLQLHAPAPANQKNLLSPTLLPFKDFLLLCFPAAILYKVIYWAVVRGMSLLS